MSYNVGDEVVLDGIPCVIVYKADTEQSWGQYLCVDRDHDLCYYFTGSDYVDEEDNENACINLEAKYGYEWGAYNQEVNINSYKDGEGLNNTNALISLNLQAEQQNWHTIWDKIKEFRELIHSDKWFLPDIDELRHVRSASILKNLSQRVWTYYWTSTEYDTATARILDFNLISLYNSEKNRHYNRARLCRYTTDSELNSKKIQISTSTPQSQIYYTINNSTPTTSSTLYTDIFQVESGTTIKAIGVKEGYENSDVAEFVVG